jgi:uncharacterized protein (DUF927 family)
LIHNILRLLTTQAVERVAKLPDEVLRIICSLQRQLEESIDETSETEWMLFERYGETESTIAELEELQNAKERLMGSYSRLHNLLLRILEAQPSASTAMLKMLSQAIEYGQATVSAVQANTQEIKRNWNLK